MRALKAFRWVRLRGERLRRNRMAMFSLVTLITIVCSRF